MEVSINPEALAAVMGHAERTPAIEVCGLLFGGAGRIDRAEPARNVADDPSAWFEIAPAALFAALRAERGGGPRLLGHYHSHPNGSAKPSATDREAAEPGRLWLIVGGGEARLWHAERDGFAPVRMIVR